MPPKKRASKPKQEVVQVELPPIPPHLLERHPQRWVSVHFKLLTSSLLDDVLRLPSNSNLFMVENKIITHHGGGISRLMMWKDDIQPKNILRDFSMTLKEAWKLNDATPHSVQHPNIPSGSGGISGALGPTRFGSYGEPEDHHVVLCYDYRAHDSDCPLLLRSPRYAVQQPQVPGSPLGGSAPGTTASGQRK